MYACMYIMIVSFAERFKFYFCSKASIKCKSSYSSTTSQTSLKAPTELLDTKNVHGPLNRHKNAHNLRLNRKIKCIVYRDFSNLHIVANTSILVNYGSFDVRVLPNTNWNATLCSQKPPVSIRLQQDEGQKQCQ